MHIRSWISDKNPETYNDHDRFNKFRLEKYISIIQAKSDKTFFISTDNEQIKNFILDTCKNVLFFDRRPDFTNIQNDFIDLLLLSKNDVLYGSILSTFTEMAWYYSGCNQKVIFP
jgi:hypothetical protein